MEHTIRIVQETLSDGSHVYDLNFPIHRISVCSRDDAEELAAKIQQAIEDHSNDSAAIIRFP
jgi:hypothetical protein